MQVSVYRHLMIDCPGLGYHGPVCECKAKLPRDGDGPIMANADSWADERGLDESEGTMYFLPTA